MWLEILENVFLSMVILLGCFQFSSAITKKLQLNPIVEKALVVILVASVGYIGFLVSWLSYFIDSNSPMIGFRILLVFGLLYLLKRREFSIEQLQLFFVCALSTLIAVATSLCRGIADPTQGIQHTLAVRYWNSVDNKIPGLFASALQHKTQLRPTLIDGWQGSDRPPIATGLVRVLSPLTNTREPDFFVIVACSSVLIVAVVLLVDVLWESRNIGIAIAISTYFAPGVFVNVVYTWPKILAASLTIVAIALLIQNKNDHKSSEPYLFLACITMILSLLTHGSSAFVFPAFLLLAFSISRSFFPLLKTISLSLLLYLPWIAYQQIWDPPGDRLVYWHLAGELGGGHSSIMRTIVLKYKDLSVVEILVNKLNNFMALFIRVDGNPAVSGHSSFLGHYRQLTTETVLGAIGLLCWLGLFIFILFGFRRTSERSRDFAVFLIFSSVVFCLLEFGDSFSTRASLVVSPMALTIGFAVLGLGSLIFWLGVNPKWIVILSISNIAIFGPIQSTAAAAGWKLQLWDLGTCILLIIGLLILVLYIIRLPEHKVNELHVYKSVKQ